MRDKFWVFILFTLLSVTLFLQIFAGRVNLNGRLLVSFYPIFGQNLPYKPTGWDQLRIYFPFYKVTFDQLRDGHLPLWNPYAFAGHPHLADFQTAVFYPLNIFGLILPQIEFWHLLRVTPAILAAYFTYLYLQVLGLSRVASFFGAISFGFSPFILTWGEEVVMAPHSIVWLPAILWAIERYLKQAGKWPLTVIAFASAFSFFGGYMQTTIYLFIFVVAYLILRMGFKKLFLGAWRLMAALALGATLAAIQLLPSAELFFHSARSEISLRQTLFDFLLPKESLLTYLAPDFFGHPATGNYFKSWIAQYYESILFVGVAVLLFATWAMFAAGAKRRKLVAFLTIFWLVSVSTTLDLPSSRLLLSLPIPFLSTSIANRVLFLPAFCLAVLAALGMDDWLTGKSKKIFWVVAAFGLVYAVLVSYAAGVRSFGWTFFEREGFSAAASATVSLRNLVIPVGVFTASAFLIVLGTVFGAKRAAAVLIVGIAFGQIFYFSQKYFSFSERRYIFPQTEALEFIGKNQGYFRSWAIGEAYLENNFASQYGIFWPEGYDSLNNRAYAEFTYAMQGHPLADFIFRSDAGLGRGKAEELLGNQAARRLLDLVGVKYVIAGPGDQEILEKKGLRRVFDPPSHIQSHAVLVESDSTAGLKASVGENSYAVFENQQVMPRVFLASNYHEMALVDSAGDAGQSIIDKLLEPDFDLLSELVLEEPSPISPQFGPGSAEIVSYKPSEVVVKTQSGEPKLLFLSDNYYPGWKAEVDGDETKILRANYTFRAVPLGPGEHTVRFYYDSAVFKVGVLISLASLGALGFLTLRRSRLGD